MSLLRAIFQAYDEKKASFATCIILMKEETFNIGLVHEISSKKSFSICSDIKIDRLIRERCMEQGGGFWDAYTEAEHVGFSFHSFPDNPSELKSPFTVHRFAEKDFENIITEIGGVKIPTSTEETPDFLLENFVLELKDVQTDSLEIKERQVSIGKIFQEVKGYTIDLNPAIDYGIASQRYHRLITNTIQKHFKKASSQIKSYRKTNEISGGGLILLNTGMFSLPHDLLKSISEKLLQQTNTIEFVFLFSQIMQTNGFDLYSVFGIEFLGNVPEKIRPLKTKVDTYINDRMKDVVTGKVTSTGIPSMKPICFFSERKIFYWNPGKLKDSRT